MPPNVSIYEKCRQDRIKENLQRMQNLGIMDLSHKLKSDNSKPIKKRQPFTKPNSDPNHRSTTRNNTTPLLQLTVSTRRSSRLQNTAPVTYCEEAVPKKGKTVKEETLWLGEGERPEVYTEEHEKLLGDTERTWELFVDGVDKDGKRIYDPVNGKTCHQCRQKTMGYRTVCSQCNPSVMGQFCGDCLYMRYGEHVIEALENPDWVCPGCRGICNCSICRKQKGWLPTGNAYRKVCKLGYKSVAHYLIHTNKQTETSEEDSSSVVLAITDGSEDDNVDGDVKPEMDPATPVIVDVKKSETSKENESEEAPSSAMLAITDGTEDDHIEDIKPMDVVEMDPATPVIVDVDTAKEKSGGVRGRKRKACSVEPNLNSIGGRLRQRRVRFNQA